MTRAFNLSITLIAIGVFFSVPGLLLMQFQGNLNAKVLLVAFLVCCGTTALAYLARDRAAVVARCVVNTLSRYDNRTWLGTVITAGIVARIAFATFFPAVIVSDGFAYTSLARSMIAGNGYTYAGDLAYLPPGYPFFLIPWLASPLPFKVAILISNLLLYTGTSFAVFHLCSRALSKDAAKIAILLLAFWPNYVAYAGLSQKENLVIFLLFLVLAFYRQGIVQGNIGIKQGFRMPLLCGVALGCAALTQPSIQLFFLVLLAYDRFSGNTYKTILIRLAIVALGAALIVLPWTVRNFVIVGEPVLISLNGGDNLYRANNDLANGAFTETGTVDLRKETELEKNRQGFTLAKAWIISHPEAFLRLIAMKQMHFLGEDSLAIYESIKLSHSAGNTVYVAAKLLATALWFSFWVILLSLKFGRPGRLVVKPIEMALLCGILYFQVLHSVFESGGKYHFPSITFMAALFGALMVRLLDDSYVRSDKRIEVSATILQPVV